MVTVPRALWYLAVATGSMVPILPLLFHLLDKVTGKVMRNILAPIRLLLNILIGLHCVVLIGSLLVSVPLAFVYLVDAVKGIDIASRLIVVGILLVGSLISFVACAVQGTTYILGGVGWMKHLR
jgi:hypothetical protein